MPRGDFTGPWGRGPMTGRGVGYCAGFAGPGFASPRGRGFGLGRGFGPARGFGGGYRAWGGPGVAWGPGYMGPMEPEAPTWQNEVAMLQETAGALEYQLKQVRKRLADLEDETRED